MNELRASALHAFRFRLADGSQVRAAVSDGRKLVYTALVCNGHLGPGPGIAGLLRSEI